MRYRIYHSLDRPSSFFGIRGRFLMVALSGAVAAVLAGLLAGQATEMIFGIAVFIAGCVFSYLATVWMQSKVTERDMMKYLLHRRLPDCWSFAPRPLRSIWRGIDS